MSMKSHCGMISTEGNSDSFTRGLGLFYQQSHLVAALEDLEVMMNFA
jgi:hypothetical protein